MGQHAPGHRYERGWSEHRAIQARDAGFGFRLRNCDEYVSRWTSRSRWRDELLFHLDLSLFERIDLLSNHLHLLKLSGY